MARHSNVFYIYRNEIGFTPVKKAVACKNIYGLDLFKYNGMVYEGRTGAWLISEDELAGLDSILKSNGGIEKLNERIEELLAKAGESPRYTRPDEQKLHVFPPNPAKENTVYAKDAYGNKHYYYRFYNENDIELYTLKKAKDFNRTVFIQCEGYMLGISQHHRLDETLKWLAGLENGVKGEIERLFNKSMANTQEIADMCYANILGRADEAKTHNEPIIESRRLENELRDVERKAVYDQAIKESENNLMNKRTVDNCGVLDDKSLVLQLFKEHDIAIPPKTRDWIINSLQAVYFNETRGDWSYHYTGSPSKVFLNYFDRLLAAVQTKQQYEEISRNDSSPDYSGSIDNEYENDMEI